MGIVIHMPFFSSIYSLRKSKRIFRHALHLLKRKRKRLAPTTYERILHTLQALKQAIEDKDRKEADALAKKTLGLASEHLKKTQLEQMRDFFVAVAFALCVAVVVRQMWFEPYEIPTGSMRPTFKEQDRLIVTKTNFGVNIPLRPDHFYFEPNLVERSGIVVFTGENMDIRDVDTLYFYIFPGKKQYIKRIMAKPGDIVYFYGGKIYGLDKEGKDISANLQRARLNAIEHIPFIDFDRKVVLPPSPAQGVFSPVYFYQMNEPVAKLVANKTGGIVGDVLNNTKIHSPDGAPMKEYFDLWGMKNFGMTRLLTKEQVAEQTAFDLTKVEDAPLYLEITHHPAFSLAKLVRDEMGRIRPSLGKCVSLLPLSEEHIQTLFRSLYTARFCVKNGIAYRYGMNEKTALANSFAPRLPDVPDGCYEFYYGKAYAVKWQGITMELPPTHPLLRYAPERMQLLYNIGIEWDMRFMPQWKEQRLLPSRYTYFRDGDLYLLGAPIVRKNDPQLRQFLEREHERSALASAHRPFYPFEDLGPPLLDNGTLDISFMKQYGLMITEKGYLALGDNHAMSSDSREFGFVPESNLRGAPSFIFWPFGSRFGTPNQPSYPFFCLPRLIIWIAAGISISIGLWVWKRRNSLPKT
jgi:signal peptidase I